MASLIAKTGAKRTGDGRECGLSRQNSTTSNRATAARFFHRKRPGHGAQAAAWNASLDFVKMPRANQTSTNTSTSSTSPETDRNTSDVFSFFDGKGIDADMLGDEEHTPAAVAKAKVERAQTDGAEDRFRNPLFHSAPANVEKAVASLFPGEEESRAATNGSNPLFTRTVPLDGASRPRPRTKRDAKPKVQRANSSIEAVRGVRDGSSRSELKKAQSVSALDTKASQDQPRKKKEKAMYEHVGRMNFRPANYGDDAECRVHGFRVDTFARNEGESGGKAHFKFVFTVDGAAVSGDASRKRPVLDAIHERETGNLRVRVNDGREISAVKSLAVEIALKDVGVVLFNPKTMSKGHHLYTLSLHGRTLFSVLA